MIQGICRIVSMILILSEFIPRYNKTTGVFIPRYNKTVAVSIPRYNKTAEIISSCPKKLIQIKTSVFITRYDKIAKLSSHPKKSLGQKIFNNSKNMAKCMQLLNNNLKI